jgi:AmmeMemoRadiSam system protein B/AmmeMemoRadiSam system protein A
MLTSKTRRPAVAGSFYPEEPKELKQMVEKFLSCDVAPAGRDTFAVLVPHAGYVYSGITAGAGFAAVRNIKFDTAIIIAISHRYAIDGAALYSGSAFDTPLNTICIDTKLNENLKKSSKFFKYHDQAHEEEHSIEVQLPFLQIVNPDTKIVPILVNTYDLDILESIGNAVGKVASENNALVVISSDLSHYPPARIAEKSDKSLLTALSISMQYEDPTYFRLANRLLLKKGLSGLETAACGETAIIAGIYCAIKQGANEFKLINYTNSGFAKGADSFSVVGYGTGIFVKSENPKDYFELSAKQKQKLLDSARNGMEYYVRNGKMQKTELSDDPRFNVPAAVFVTLHKNGALRGCIGNLKAEGMLEDEINKYACLAAFEDSRFSPVAEDELENISIEISILSRLKRIKSLDEITEGKHGVFVCQGLKTGTYLPQVWKHFKTKKEFINSLLCEKAGLPAGALKDSKTKLYTYTVQSFEE